MALLSWGAGPSRRSATQRAGGDGGVESDAAAECAAIAAASLVGLTCRTRGEMGILSSLILTSPNPGILFARSCPQTTTEAVCECSALISQDRSGLGTFLLAGLPAYHGVAGRIRSIPGNRLPLALPITSRSPRVLTVRTGCCTGMSWCTRALGLGLSARIDRNDVKQRFE